MFFFFKQKTAYEMRISDWSSDVCSSDLYVVGQTERAGIGPAPDHPSHLEALLRVVAGRPLKAIICTHTHRDHSPASRPLQQATGAPILGCAPLVRDDDGPRADASFDSDYAPNAVLSEGEAVQGEGWRLETVAKIGRAHV